MFAKLPSIQWAVELTEQPPDNVSQLHEAVERQVESWRETLAGRPNIGLRKSISRKLKETEAHLPVIRQVAFLQRTAADPVLFGQPELWTPEVEGALQDLDEEQSAQLRPILLSLKARARSTAPPEPFNSAPPSGQSEPVAAPRPTTPDEAPEPDPPTAPPPPSTPPQIVPEPEKPPPASATGTAEVVGWVLERPTSRDRLHLAVGQILPLGRNRDCVPHPVGRFYTAEINADKHHPTRKISKLHCRLMWTHEGLGIADGDGRKPSSNGTRLRGETIPDHKVVPMNLALGDTAHLHLFKIPFQITRSGRQHAVLRWRIAQREEVCHWAVERLGLRLGADDGPPEFCEDQGRAELVLSLGPDGPQVTACAHVSCAPFPVSAMEDAHGWRLNWKGQTWTLRQRPVLRAATTG